MGEFDFLNNDRKKSGQTATKKRPQEKEKNSISEDHPGTNPDLSLEEYRRKHKYDPRPDVEVDHHIWIQLLRIAENENKDIYNLLHGLRCCGCQVKLERGWKLKLDLDNSPKLLEYFIPNEELEKLPGEKKYEQEALFNNIAEKKKRKEQIKRRKKLKKLRKKAVKRIKEEELQPKVKGIVKVFGRINNQVKKLRDKSAGKLNIQVVDNYFKAIQNKNK